MTKLTDFLMRNSAVVGKPLPLVHTCQSYRLESIMRSNKIRPQFCEFFNENLSYFFMGRPAYKKDFGDEAAEWELPVCFIFSYDISFAKRIFPFDSGAMKRNLYPTFIDMMDLEEFELSTASDAPSRIVGTFFGSTRNYFKMKPLDEDKFESKYALGAFDAEIRALHRLMIKTGKPADRSTDFKRIDERRSTVEIQTPNDEILQKKDLLAVVLPEPYFLEPNVPKFFESLGARLISYQVFPLNPNLYYGIIYDKIFSFFQEKRYV